MFTLFSFPARSRQHGRRAFLIAVALWGAVAALLLSRPLMVRAQLSRLPQVAVMDLNGPNTPDGEILARQATDAVVVEMQRSGRFDVIPHAQVVQQIRELGLPQPLDQIGLIKLGQALGANYVATGAVTRLEADTKPGGKARATIAVVLTDPQTGEATNGAWETAQAVAGSTIAEKEALSSEAARQARVLQALNNAAFQVVRTLNNYTLPEATVLILRDGGTVRINGGARSGVYIGQEFIVLRGGDRVGRIRITSVSDQDAEATILDTGKGIRPEDRARAVFRFGDFAR